MGYLRIIILRALEIIKKTLPSGSVFKCSSLGGVEPPAFRLGGGPSILLRYKDIYYLNLLLILNLILLYDKLLLLNTYTYINNTNVIMRSRTIITTITVISV